MTTAERTPLYARTYDLTRSLFERTARFPKSHRFVMARRVQSAAFELLEAINLALLQRDGRGAQLAMADEALTRLRLAVRLCRDLGLFPTRQHAHLADELGHVGRMLGGWRRSLAASSAASA